MYVVEPFKRTSALQLIVLYSYETEFIVRTNFDIYVFIIIQGIFGTVMVVIVVGFITTYVSSNTTQVRCTLYNIMWLNLSVTCDRSVVSPGTPVSSTTI